MKRWILTVILVLGLTSSGFASPLMDYSKGAGSLDISLKPNQDISVEQNGHDAEFDGKSSNLGLGITYGLGNDWALQYRFNNADTKVKHDPQRDDSIDFRVHEFNVLHKVGKNVSAFAGAVRTKSTSHNSNWADKADDQTGYQLGLIGVAGLGPKTNAYGIVSAGNDIRRYEVGVSYGFAKNLEVNVAYEYAKYEDGGSHFFHGVMDEDYVVKGLKYGLVYKF